VDFGTIDIVAWTWATDTEDLSIFVTGPSIAVTKNEIEFRWQPVTVRLDQLRGGSQLPKPVGCEVLPEAVRDDNHATASDGASPAQR